MGEVQRGLGGHRGVLGAPPALSPPPPPPVVSLQQTLYEKWGEFRSLMVQEQRLVRGERGGHPLSLSPPPPFPGTLDKTPPSMGICWGGCNPLSPPPNP